MQNQNRHWRRILLIAGCMLVAGGVHAERADRDKPVNLEADQVTVDDAKQTATFIGKVVLTQGTLVIRGDRMVVQQDADGFKYGVAYGNPRTNNFGAGLRYSLSKRTILYAGYSRFNLKVGAQGQAFSGYSGIADASNSGLYTTANLFSAAGTPNVNPYSYQFGIRHSF